MTTKRALDEDDPTSKRPRTESTLEDDLKFLKLLIKAEVAAVYDEKFKTLTDELADLKNKYNQVLAKLPPPLPPRAPQNDSKPAAISPPRNLTPADGSTADSSSADITSTSTSSPAATSKPALNRVSSDKPKHTFGGTSFKIKPMVATPTHSLVEPKTPKDTPIAKDVTPKDSDVSTPRPVFGATTSFGLNSVLDKMKVKKNVFADLPSSSQETSSFGANSKFSNSFRNSVSKKSFLDEEKEQATQEQPEQQENKEPEPEPEQKPEKKPITTGEENEKVHFTSMCKLFELNFEKISDGWKERGLGQLHLNQSIETPDQVRLVMRSNGLLRVILNSKITKDTEIFKGYEASMAPGKYLRFNSLSEGKPVQYLLKFSNPNLRDDLFEKIQNLQQEI